ncbi:MAG: hypothetical protein ACXQTD_06155 [Candidatus Syntropharchaeia archaeon]
MRIGRIVFVFLVMAAFLISMVGGADAGPQLWYLDSDNHPAAP